MIDLFETRHKLYSEYLEELEFIRGTPFSEPKEEQRQWCQDYLDQPYYTWVDIKQKDKIIGFLIMGTYPDCHPDCDYFICQSYVLPGYRGNGLMTKAVTSFIKEHKGYYCLMIIDRNVKAQRFWSRIFTDCNYIRFELSEVVQLCHGESQYGYKPQ